MPNFKELRDRISQLGSRFLTRTWHAEAALADGTRLRCLVAGSRIVAEYLLAMPCFATATADPLPMRLDLLAHLGEAGSEPLDLGLAALTYELEIPDGAWQYRQPEYVRQVLDLSPGAPPNRRLAAKMKETERRVRRSGLTCEVSHDATDFEFFYERMFLPHTRNQFGAYADIESPEAMEPYFRRGFLVFATLDGVRLTGSLCLVENGTLVYRRMGVLDGDRAHLASGAQAANYSFFVTLAREMGCHAVDFMNSRPFPNDGVFRHKRDWGASVEPEPHTARDIYHVHLGPPGLVARFYAENPAVVMTEGGLEVLTGAPDGGALDVDDLRRRLYSPGLAGARVLRGDGSAPDRVAFSAAPAEPA